MSEELLKMKTKFYWSRRPGKFVNKLTGVPVDIGPVFTGTVREWYETLVETIYDILNQTHEETNAIYVGRELATLLEASMLYRPALNIQYPYPSVGITKIGTLRGRDVYLEPSQKENLILIGHHNGGSWWEGEIEVLDMNII
jgi:hypothetical protein